MNVRRGFNRLFVLAWVVWVLVGMWWVMDSAKEYRAKLDLQIRRSEDWYKYRQTDEAAADLAELRKERDESAEWNIVKEFITTRNGLLLVAVVYLGLPAICYAVLFGAGWATGWVYRGFRSPDPREPKERVK
jgi:hypothetical protein